VLDDDATVRDSLRALLTASGFSVETRCSSQDLRDRGIADGTGCIIVDVRLGEDDDGINLVGELRRAGMRLPIIMITGHADVPLAVRAMREGATNFIEKPFAAETLLQAIADALAEGSRGAQAASVLSRLTVRERQVLDRLARGMANKVVARELGISVRTVEAYRAAIMSKVNAKSLADLVRLHLLAGGAGQAD
jgi:two-component system response regulator FixJ